MVVVVEVGVIDAHQTGNNLMFLHHVGKNICKNLHEISWRGHRSNLKTPSDGGGWMCCSCADRVTLVPVNSRQHLQQAEPRLRRTFLEFCL